MKKKKISRVWKSKKPIKKGQAREKSIRTESGEKYIPVKIKDVRTDPNSGAIITVYSPVKGGKND